MSYLRSNALKNHETSLPHCDANRKKLLWHLFQLLEDRGELKLLQDACQQTWIDPKPIPNAIYQLFSSFAPPQRAHGRVTPELRPHARRTAHESNSHKHQSVTRKGMKVSKRMEW